MTSRQPAAPRLRDRAPGAPPPRCPPPLRARARAPPACLTSLAALLRIDVDREARSPQGAVRGRVDDRLADGGHRGLALAALHEQLRAVAALAAEERGRTEHGYARRHDPLAHGLGGRGLGALLL